HLPQVHELVSVLGDARQRGAEEGLQVLAGAEGGAEVEGGGAEPVVLIARVLLGEAAMHERPQQPVHRGLVQPALLGDVAQGHPLGPGLGEDPQQHQRLVDAADGAGGGHGRGPGWFLRARGGSGHLGVLPSVGRCCRVRRPGPRLVTNRRIRVPSYKTSGWRAVRRPHRRYRMAIDRIDVDVTSPGRNLVTVTVTTSDRLIRLSDGTLNGRELAVASYLRDHVAPTLIGRDEPQIEAIWQYLYRGPYWRRGPVTMSAVAAIDMALWDIAAKKAGEPLYKLLGGASRTGLLAYAHASGSTIEKLNDAVRGYVDEGFQAVRIQAGVPGLDQIYGVHDAAPGGKYEYEPAGRPAAGAPLRPTEETWDTAAYLRHLPSVFAGVREEFGPELRLLHDGHHRMSPIEAARLAKSLEPYDPFWLEDCTPGEDQTVLRLVRQHSVTPLAIGEVF